jgi:hypothetical protein
MVCSCCDELQQVGAAAVRWPAVGEEEEKRKEREKKERRVGALASNSNVAPSTPTKFVCFNLVFDFHFYFILISVFLNSLFWFVFVILF